MNTNLPDGMKLPFGMELNGAAVGVIQMAIILVAGLILLRVGLRALDAMVARSPIDEVTFRPVRSVIRWVGLLVILAFVMGRLGVDILPGLTAVLAMIAVGFIAVWSVVSNFLCTFLLIFFRPFKIGDRIAFPGEEIRGRVLEITTLFTILEDEDGSVFHVPNNLFFQKSIKRLPVKMPL